MLEHLVGRMKEVDPLFKSIYSRICGAGSYYDGLKVGKPEEFDMDVVIRFPVYYQEFVVSHVAAAAPFFKHLHTFCQYFWFNYFLLVTF